MQTKMEKTENGHVAFDATELFQALGSLQHGLMMLGAAMVQAFEATPKGGVPAMLLDDTAKGVFADIFRSMGKINSIIESSVKASAAVSEASEHREGHRLN